LKKEAEESGEKGTGLKNLKRRIDIRTMKDRDQEQKRYLKTLYTFKQCIMETILKRREEYVQPSLGEAAAKIKEENEKKNEEKKRRGKMTVKEIFAKPSDELS